MDTAAAMAYAFKLKAVKEKYSRSTLSSMKTRLKNGKITLDKQIEFLNENGFAIKRDIIWQRTKKLKAGRTLEAPVTELREEVVILPGVPVGERAMKPEYKSVQ